MTTTLTLPEGLAARPIDSRRKVPIPWVNVTAPNGEADFTAIDSDKSVRCATERLCGLCGRDLGYWIAFLGGPKSAETRAYIDPPMHIECAEAAMLLCPHIARSGAKRRRNPLTASVAPSGFVEARPDWFVLYITRTFKCVIKDGCLIFRPAPAMELREQASS